MKIVTVIGARPQFVKAATISRAILQHNLSSEQKIEEIIVHTGQHYDSNMSDVFFEEMEIPQPSYTLNIGGGNHGAMTGRQLEKVEEVLLAEQPDYVLVYGDTNSTLAGALAAAKLHIPVAHVEAGLRSFNMKMPEEVNRILTDQISEFLFCPTQTAVKNLNAEGFSTRPGNIHLVGDVMYDAALFYSPKAVKPLGVEDTYFALVTIHRADNTDDLDRLSSIISALNEINLTTPVICPIHPRTQKVMEQANIKPEFTLLPPVSYFEMMWLLQNAKLVITDSGGLQKEAYFFEKQCITMRDQTEWVELIEAGVNRLVGADRDKIIDAYQTLSFSTSSGQGLYGDGNAAHEILSIILDAHLSGKTEKTINIA